MMVSTMKAVSVERMAVLPVASATSDGRLTGFYRANPGARVVPRKLQSPARIQFGEFPRQPRPDAPIRSSRSARGRLVQDPQKPTAAMDIAGSMVPCYGSSRQRTLQAYHEVRMMGAPGLRNMLTGPGVPQGRA